MMLSFDLSNQKFCLQNQLTFNVISTKKKKFFFPSVVFKIIYVGFICGSLNPTMIWSLIQVKTACNYEVCCFRFYRARYWENRAQSTTRKFLSSEFCESMGFRDFFAKHRGSLVFNDYCAESGRIPTRYY